MRVMLDVACDANMQGARVQLLLARPTRLRLQLLLLYPQKKTEACCTHRHESVHTYSCVDVFASGFQHVLRQDANACAAPF